MKKFAEWKVGQAEKAGQEMEIPQQGMRIRAI
jgi:hypothetical protein